MHFTALDSVVVVVKTQNNQIQLTHYDVTKKMTLGIQIVKALENLKLSHDGPSIWV